MLGLMLKPGDKVTYVVPAFRDVPDERMDAEVVRVTPRRVVIRVKGRDGRWDPRPRGVAFTSVTFAKVE